MSRSLSPWIEKVIGELLNFDISPHLQQHQQANSEGKATAKQQQQPQLPIILHPARTVQSLKYLSEAKALIVSDSQHTIPLYLTPNALQELIEEYGETELPKILKNSFFQLKEFHFTTALIATGDLLPEYLLQHQKILSFPFSISCNSLEDLGGSMTERVGNPVDINSSTKMWDLKKMNHYELFLKFAYGQFHQKPGFLPVLGYNAPLIRALNYEITEKDLEISPEDAFVIKNLKSLNRADVIQKSLLPNPLPLTQPQPTTSSSSSSGVILQGETQTEEEPQETQVPMEIEEGETLGSQTQTQTHTETQGGPVTQGEEAADAVKGDEATGNTWHSFAEHFCSQAALETDFPSSSLLSPPIQPTHEGMAAAAAHHSDSDDVLSTGGLVIQMSDENEKVQQNANPVPVITSLEPIPATNVPNNNDGNLKDQGSEEQEKSNNPDNNSNDTKASNTLNSDASGGSVDFNNPALSSLKEFAEHRAPAGSEGGGGEEEEEETQFNSKEFNEWNVSRFSILPNPEASKVTEGGEREEEAAKHLMSSSSSLHSHHEEVEGGEGEEAVDKPKEIDFTLSSIEMTQSSIPGVLPPRKYPADSSPSFNASQTQFTYETLPPLEFPQTQPPPQERAQDDDDEDDNESNAGTFSDTSSIGNIVIINDNNANNQIKVRKQKKKGKKKKNNTKKKNLLPKINESEEDPDSLPKEIKADNNAEEESTKSDKPTRRGDSLPTDAEIWELIGKKVSMEFQPKGLARKELIIGQISDYASPFYLVNFDDGEKRNLYFHEVIKIVVPDIELNLEEREFEPLTRKNTTTSKAEHEEKTSDKPQQSNSTVSPATPHELIQEKMPPKAEVQSLRKLKKFTEPVEVTPIAIDEDEEKLYPKKINMDVSIDLDGEMTQPQYLPQHLQVNLPQKHTSDHNNNKGKTKGINTTTKAPTEIPSKVMKSEFTDLQSPKKKRKTSSNISHEGSSHSTIQSTLSSSSVTALTENPNLRKYLQDYESKKKGQQKLEKGHSYFEQNKILFEALEKRRSNKNKDEVDRVKFLTSLAKVPPSASSAPKIKSPPPLPPTVASIAAVPPAANNLQAIMNQALTLLTTKKRKMEAQGYSKPQPYSAVLPLLKRAKQN